MMVLEVGVEFIFGEGNKVVVIGNILLLLRGDEVVVKKDEFGEGKLVVVEKEEFGEGKLVVVEKAEFGEGKLVVVEKAEFGEGKLVVVEKMGAAVDVLFIFMEEN